MSESDSQEVIEDLRDQIHDLEQDLRDAAKETERLEAELAEQYGKDSDSEADKAARIKSLEDQVHGHQLNEKSLETRLQVLQNKVEGGQVKFVKALSIAECLKMNGEGYFHTSDGRKLLEWAIQELRTEATKIMNEEKI